MKKENGQKQFSYEREPGIKRKQPLWTPGENSSMDMENPQVSIVTPYYNSDAHLEQTFRCVMNQTLGNFEWIIVNDGSTRPEAVGELERLAEMDVRIRVLHQENGGQSKAKNHGVRESRADVIVFLDADDLVEDFYLELLCKALREHPNAAWSYTDLVGFGAWEYMWVKPFSAGRMTFNNTLVNAAAFRKEALLEVGVFDEVYKHYDEDWALYLKLLGAGYHPVHVPVIGFWYRRSDTGMQQTVRKDDALRKESDAYMDKLAGQVDIKIKGEEYKGDLPAEAVVTSYGAKEKILKALLSHSLGVKLISGIYKRK